MNKVTALTIGFMLLAGAGLVMAGQGHDHKMSDGTMMKDDAMSKGQMDSKAGTAVEVGNKICPVSGEKIGEMGDGVKYEHNGKIYNLCCAGCNKPFSKDPANYSAIAEKEVSGQK